MTGKEVFVDREVLVSDEPGPRLVLPNRVDQQGWITVMNAVEERGKVDVHLPIFWAQVWGAPVAERQEPQGAEPQSQEPRDARQARVQAPPWVPQPQARGSPHRTVGSLRLSGPGLHRPK